MNEKLVERIKDELVVLGLFKTVKIEKTIFSDGISVVIDEDHFFRVTERDDKYFLYYRTRNSPILGTKNITMILLEVRELIAEYE